MGSSKVYIHREPLITVSSETGEVTGIVLEDGDVICKKQEDETVYINRGRQFVKLFPDIADLLCRRLSGNALFLCFSIIPYITKESGILKKRNGQAVTASYLVSQTGKSDKTVRRAIQELVRCGVLAKAIVRRRQVFIANPYIFQNGVRANATLLQLFDKSGWRGI